MSVATRLGFVQNRQKGSHARWLHPDGRAMTIPFHGDTEIGPPLYFRLLRQLGISDADFRRMK
jgi:predicted RNA binding protein YcfA (HicA-like mRNA interferase family)